MKTHRKEATLLSTIIEGVSHLNKDELEAVLNDPQSKTIVIDVREIEEYVAGHIPGVPLIPMGHIPELIDQFDKEAEYVFVCRSGSRSLNVAKFFQRAGIARVHNFAGGILTWDKELAQGEGKIIEDFSMTMIRRT